MNTKALAEKLWETKRYPHTESDIAAQVGWHYDFWQASLYSYVTLRDDYCPLHYLLNPVEENPRNELEELMKAAGDTVRMYDNYLYEIKKQVQDEYGRLFRADREAKKCTRCNGNGYLLQYAHWENGICFKCNGTGEKGMGHDVQEASVWDM